MKKLVLTLVGVTAIGLSSAFGQGSVNFANAGNWNGIVLNQPVKLQDGSNPASGAYWVNLLWGPDAGSVTTPVTAAPISIGANGFFFGQAQTITGAAIGSTPYFKVQVWDKTGGTSLAAAASSGLAIQLGESAVFQLGQPMGNPAPGSLPAPPLFGMAGFNMTLVPEPSTFALLALGGLALLIRRRK
jgi:hypothetical protein